MKITKEQQREEAIVRLRILEEKGLMPQVRRDFEQGTINFSERMTIPGLGTNGILYWLHDNPEFDKLVRDFEERTDSVVYHATHEVFEGIGKILDLFYVSKYAEEWQQDRDDLKDGYSMVYAVNLDVDWCSDFGTVSFAACGGGLVRSA